MGVMRSAREHSGLGALVTVMVAGAGAYLVWRARKIARCPRCDREIRPGAHVCRHCGEIVAHEGPIIDVPLIE